MTIKSNAEAAKGRRESNLILVDNQDYNGTFHVNSLRNDLWCVGCVVVVDRIPSALSAIQRDCHSLENLCKCAMAKIDFQDANNLWALGENGLIKPVIILFLAMNIFAF